MRQRRDNSMRTLAIVVIATASLAYAPAARTQDLDVGKASKVKAAYLLNFIKFVSWPSGSFENDAAALMVAIIGHGPVGQAVADTMQGKTALGRSIRIVRFDAGLEDSHVIWSQFHVAYICRSEQNQLSAVVEQLRSASTLTVSDIGGFAEHGGMIGYILDAGKIRFEVNRTSMDKAGLRASAKLLSLASTIRH